MPGWKVGFEASARIQPSRGSSATMPPPFAAREDTLTLLQVEVLRPVDRLLDRDRDAGVAAALLELRDHLGDGHIDDLREPAELVEPCRPRLRQIGGQKLNGGGGAVVDDRLPVTIDDRAARGLERDRAELVVERRVQVLGA